MHDCLRAERHRAQAQVFLKTAIVRNSIKDTTGKGYCASRTDKSNRFHPNRHIQDPMLPFLSLQVLLALVQHVIDIVLADEVRGILQKSPQQVPVNDRLVPSHMFPNPPRLRAFLHCGASATDALPEQKACLPNLPWYPTSQTAKHTPSSPHLQAPHDPSTAPHTPHTAAQDHAF